MDIADSSAQEASNKSDRDLLGLSLILLSSVLLGIWAVKGTIALRNILLGIETVLSIVYCYQFFKTNTQKIPLRNWIPIIMVGMMFCWVIFHYFFLSRFPEIQFHELKSTWLRALLATIVGFGTGLAILRRPNAVNFLWLGILTSFAYLFYQYIPLAISTNNINYHGYDSFIYPGKISGVLAGTILISGLLGTLLDRYPSLNIKSKIIMVLFWLIGSCVVLYAHVYIFDARNGIGLGVLIFGLVSMMFLMQISSLLINRLCLKLALRNGLFVLVLIGVVGWFGWEQFKVNPGWSSMIEDAKIAIQIEKYPNWQNPRTLGYPQSLLGKEVAANTYERLSWATAAITVFIPENLLGAGILSKPFGVLLNAKYPNSGSYILSTHSAWVELALAFGIPALIFTLGALVAILVLSATAKSPFKYLPAILSFAIIPVYTAGEISSQHSIEILYFWITLLGASLFPSVTKRLENQ
ncbi:hypothetical protein ICN17_01350 [Polynucleobacter sp. 73C-SIWE]|uniref:hypothetical protein n=1 Tax=Polynucleobacter sp. 73C-SIWE TaxID=2689098 RepID=UPI001C0D5577|nr:hypothetical protein [Polynucleobacter sp. 73C-SIWE]MBU3578648.1 hypothetical protein [Polynucleobacter sp. 73C-SIWE]